MRSDINEYEELAREIRRLFESRFGELSSKDFSEVAKLLGFELLRYETPLSYEERYEKLSELERDQVDFMMKL